MSESWSYIPKREFTDDEKHLIDSGRIETRLDPLTGVPQWRAHKHLWIYCGIPSGNPADDAIWRCDCGEERIGYTP